MLGQSSTRARGPKSRDLGSSAGSFPAGILLVYGNGSPKVSFFFVGVAAGKNSAAKNLYTRQLLLILVNCHQVEPVTLLSIRPEELNFPVSECPEQPFVPHVAHPVKCQLCPPLLQKDGLHSDIVGFWRAAKVVH
jgi:hypothetical protein